MLASAAEDLEQLDYRSRLMASPKLDGIRALVINGELVSRTFKPIPNRHIRELLSKPEFEGFDGELTVGDTFQSSSSGVMSHDGTPDFTYHVFDSVDSDLKEVFYSRLKKAQSRVMQLNLPYLKFVSHTMIEDQAHLLQYEAECIKLGYEGVMLRSSSSPYKCGRSSVKEGYLLKIKKFTDAEAVVIGYEELMSNQNAAEKDAFGKTKRSTKAEGMFPAGVLGALVVRDLATNIEFKVSTGMDADQRYKYWQQRDALMGKIVKYKSQEAGVLNLPRFPVFLGFRSPEDM
jgi:DNA ligase-1